MKKKRLLILTVVASSLAISIPIFINKQTEISKMIKGGNKDICVIEDTSKVLADNIKASKIDNYEGITGYDWLDENQIICSKENKEIKPIKTDPIISKETKEMNSTKVDFGDVKVQNLYSYDLNSKQGKSIADKSKYQTHAISSPDKKHIFYVNDFEKESVAYIADKDGNIKLKINEPGMDVADLTQAYWMNNDELIMPYTSIKGFYTVKIDGTSTKIENVEKGKMSTEDPLNGKAIMNPVKIENEVYYRTQFKSHDKMRVYDVNTKETKDFVDWEVLDYQLSPDKKQFIMEIYDFDKQNNSLIVTDTHGKKIQVIDDGIFGSSWSPDCTKVSYISNEDGDNGVYVVDMKTNEKSLVAKGEKYIPTKWSPSGKKIMFNGTQEKDGKLVHFTNIITLD